MKKEKAFTMNLCILAYIIYTVSGAETCPAQTLKQKRMWDKYEED